MRTTTTKNLRHFLFVCFGLTVATITFAGISRPPSLPGSPGRPSACDIEADWCNLRYKKPISNGGAKIELYRIEYAQPEVFNWQLEKTDKPQFTYDDIVQSRVDNRVGLKPVIFRVFAKNVAGIGKASLNSDPITFKNPF